MLRAPSVGLLHTSFLLKLGCKQASLSNVLYVALRALTDARKDKTRSFWNEAICYLFAFEPKEAARERQTEKLGFSPRIP